MSEVVSKSFDVLAYTFNTEGKPTQFHVTHIDYGWKILLLCRKICVESSHRSPPSTFSNHISPLATTTNIMRRTINALRFPSEFHFSKGDLLPAFESVIHPKKKSTMLSLMTSLSCTIARKREINEVFTECRCGECTEFASTHKKWLDEGGICYVDMATGGLALNLRACSSNLAQESL